MSISVKKCPYCKAINPIQSVTCKCGEMLTGTKSVSIDASKIDSIDASKLRKKYNSREGSNKKSKKLITIEKLATEKGVDAESLEKYLMESEYRIYSIGSRSYVDLNELKHYKKTIVKLLSNDGNHTASKTHKKQYQMSILAIAIIAVLYIFLHPEKQEKMQKIIFDVDSMSSQKYKENYAGEYILDDYGASRCKYRCTWEFEDINDYLSYDWKIVSSHPKTKLIDDSTKCECIGTEYVLEKFK